MAAAEPYRVNLDFTDAPTVCRFLQDYDSFVRMLVGPVGSGKTVGSCAEVGKIAMEQLPHPRDNIRYSRFAVVRNTSPELKTTTINTWLEHYTEQACGPLKYTSPIEHHIKVAPGKDGEPGLDMQVYFVPLDKPADVRKLKSFELTAGYINELSEVPRSIVMMLRRRVGRFPKRIKAPDLKRLYPKWWQEHKQPYQAVHPCVFGDSNATDEDHWLHELAVNPPHGWALYKQPPAVLQVDRKGKCIDIEPYRNTQYSSEAIIDAAGKHWVVNPGAENLDNLVTGYYAVQQLPGSKLDEIQRDVQAKWVYVSQGKPCIPSYNDELYAYDEIQVLQEQPIMLGLDVGGGTLQPAAVFGQRHPWGVWLIHGEVIGRDVGLVAFVREVLNTYNELFGKHAMGRCWGDPSAEKPDELFEVIISKHLKSRGIPFEAAPSNSPKLRIEAIEAPLGRMVEGQPSVRIHKRCKALRKALNGAWHYKRMQVTGEEKFHEAPNKNHPYSDVGDALGYLLLGGGEHRVLTSGQVHTPAPQAPVVAQTFNPLA